MLSRTLFAIGALGLAAGLSGASELVDRVVAVLDRSVITLSEAEQAQALQKLQCEACESNLTQVVERLIERRLIERELARYPHEKLTDELVEEAVEGLREVFPDEESFRLTLDELELEEAELYDRFQRELRINRYLERRFRGLVYVTEEEIETYYREELPRDAGAVPELSAVAELIRRLLEEKKFNARLDAWITELKSEAQIKRYVW